MAIEKILPEARKEMDPPCATCGAVRSQKDKKFFVDLPDDFLLMTVIPCGARRDFLEKFSVELDEGIRFRCTLMKMQTAEQFTCLVTNDGQRTYFGCPGWRDIAHAYGMEAGERATFCLEYDHEEIIVYYGPASSSGSNTPDYDPDSNCRRI